MESILAGGSEDFNQFLRNNRNRVGKSLNVILWFVILVGPAIAIGIKTGVFRQTSYYACIVISVSMLILAVVDRILLNRMPYSYVPGIVALIGMELLLCFMNDSHISIRISWFVVPLLSLLFCDRWAFIGTSVVCYVMMGISTWIESTHYSGIREDFATPLAAFINIFSGLSIEAVVIFIASSTLLKQALTSAELCARYSSKRASRKYFSA